MSIINLHRRVLIGVSFPQFLALSPIMTLPQVSCLRGKSPHTDPQTGSQLENRHQDELAENTKSILHAKMFIGLKTNYYKFIAKHELEKYNYHWNYF